MPKINRDRKLRALKQADHDRYNRAFELFDEAFIMLGQPPLRKTKTLSEWDSHNNMRGYMFHGNSSNGGIICIGLYKMIRRLCREMGMPIKLLIHRRAYDSGGKKLPTHRAILVRPKDASFITDIFISGRAFRDVEPGKQISCFDNQALERNKEQVEGIIRGYIAEEKKKRACRPAKKRK